jgi:16S rRNA (guanine966-N2)-methyltransferase
MIRLTSGKLKGRQLLTQKGKHTRPTLSKTRDAIFNMLMSRLDLDEYDACDLFAGSGALGFEAYSRGVNSVLFVENNLNAIQLLKKNITHFNISGFCFPIYSDAIQFLKKNTWGNFKTLFLVDPPYQTDLISKTISTLDLLGEIMYDNVIVLETDLKTVLDYPVNFEVIKEKKFSKTRIHLVQINPL